uniref:Uncharacterized protein n=1 Tax=Anopheles coluzzii TaxID=1518534 RepID=A0A8W7NZ56_ANOCL
LGALHHRQRSLRDQVVGKIVAELLAALEHLPLDVRMPVHPAEQMLAVVLERRLHDLAPIEIFVVIEHLGRSEKRTLLYERFHPGQRWWCRFRLISTIVRAVVMVLLFARNRAHQSDGYAAHQIDLLLRAYERTVTHHLLPDREACAGAKIDLLLFGRLYLIPFGRPLVGRHLTLQLVAIPIRAHLRVRYQLRQLGRIRTLLEQLAVNVDKLGQIHPRTAVLRAAGQQYFVVANNFRTLLALLLLVIDRADTFRFRAGGRGGSASLLLAALFHLPTARFPPSVRPPTVGQIERTVTLRTDLRLTIQAPDGALHDELE